MTINFTGYSISVAELDPVPTLAAAATRSNDHAMPLLLACFEQIVRRVNMDGDRVRTVQQKLEEVSKAVTEYIKDSTDKGQTAQPQPWRWISSLFFALIAVALLLPFWVLAYSHFFPEQWKAYQDSVIEGHAQSFKYYTTWGWFGETIVQRNKRMLAEAQRLKQENELKKMVEAKKELRKLVEAERKKNEERRRKKEAELEAELEAARRADALRERNMTLWARLLHRSNAGDRRFKRYRRP